ncbi:MAG TPA: dehydrogenase [Firmicutes bacterium]|jgi:2-desacetyl-2-hydroxyethyl bacteriochlorophyllide A dehydrogenase|nr:dehydrogenase [Bacillota bacterium]
MKALVYQGPHAVGIEERPIPHQKGNALIKVSYSGICGSDLSIVDGKHPRAKAPLIMGHEFSGKVMEVESNQDNITVGDRVTMYPLLSCGKCLPCRTGNSHVCRMLGLIGIDCDGSMAEYVSVPTHMLVKIPDAIDDEIGALLEPLAVVVHGVHQGRFRVMDEVMITGGGPIGILTGIVMKNIGAAHVYITEIDPFRLSVCKEVGLDVIDMEKENPIEYIKEKTDGEGVDLLVEASGVPVAAQQTTELVRCKGTICMLGIQKSLTPIDLRQLNFKEITMVGSRVYTKEAFKQAVNFAPQINDVLRKVITHRFSLADGVKAFEAIHDKKQNTLKVLIKSN